VVAHAEGPLSGGVPYAGTTGDLDRYFFYAAGPTRIGLTVAAPGCSEYLNKGLRVSLADANSKPLAQQAVEIALPQTTGTLQLVVPRGTHRYYVMLDAACYEGPIGYTLRIDPASSVGSGPSPFANAINPPEPNEAPTRAYGPLVPDRPYFGLRGTVNDTDWLYFYARGDKVLDIQMTAGGLPCPSGVCQCESDIGNAVGTGINLVDARGRDLAHGSALVDSIQHIRYTTPPMTRRYYIRARCGYEGDSYLLRVGPTDALTTAVPPECKSAKVARMKATRSVRRARERVGRARDRRAKRRAQRTLSAARTKLSRRISVVNRLCP
jgi:hypothetical protein